MKDQTQTGPARAFRLACLACLALAGCGGGGGGGSSVREAPQPPPPRQPPPPPPTTLLLSAVPQATPTRTSPAQLAFRSMALGTPAASDGRDYRSTEFMGHWGLAAISADTAYQRGYFGQGVTIAVADIDGVDITHPDLAGRIVAPRHIGNGNANVPDSTGRSSYVALLAAGARDNSSGNFQIAISGGAAIATRNVHGVAPRASIMPIVARETREMPRAMQHAITNGAQVINFGVQVGFRYFGTRAGESGLWQAELPAFRPIIERGLARFIKRNDFSTTADVLDNADVVTVWATGLGGWNSIRNEVSLCGKNSRLDTDCPLGETTLTAEQFMEDFTWLHDTFDPLRTLRLRDMWGTDCGRANCAEYNSPGGWAEAPLFEPGLLGKWLVVGSLDQNNRISDFSSGCGAARNWCLFAPGEDLSVRLAGSGISGTRYATALVSGALAVLKSRLSTMPMEVVQAVLLASADPLGRRVSNPDEPDEVYGWGRLNLGRAITMQGSVRLPYSTSGASSANPISLVYRSMSLDAPNPSDGRDYRTPEFMGHWGLAAISADTAYQRGYFGQGVTIAIADSGVDISHSDLAGRIVAPIHLRNGNANVADRVGHGTYVALLAAGARGNTGGNFRIDVGGGLVIPTNNVHGVAPRASIMPISVASTRPQHPLVPRALRHAVANGAQVINFSIGESLLYTGRRAGESGVWRTLRTFPTFRPIIERDLAPRLPRHKFSEAAAALENADIVAVWASGNERWSSGFVWDVPVCGRNTFTDPDCSGILVEIINPQREFMETFSWIYDPSDPSRTLSFRDMWGTDCGGVDCIEYNSPGGWAEAPLFEPSLLGKWLVVGSLAQNDWISDFSNGCGAAKNWCLVAPGEGLTISSGGRAIQGTSFAAPLVSGALAVLKSRLPSMPMEVVQAVLLVSADPLGSRRYFTNRPDDLYGWGRLNLGRAITMQGTVNLPYSEVQTTTTSTSTQQAQTTTSATTQAVPLLGTRVTLSPALAHAARQMQAVEVAVSGVGHAHYNMPLSALAVVETARQPVLGHAAWDMLTPAGGWHIAGPGGYGPFVEWAGRGDVRASGLGAGGMNAWAMHANYMHRGGLGVDSADSIYSGGLHAIGMDLSLGSLGRWRVRHELCGDCEESVWREWRALAPAGPSVAAPFFADAGGAVALYMPGSGLRPFVAASSGRETRQAPWRQFGVRWLSEGKRLLSALEVSLVDESRSVWGARFGALANARTRTWQGRLFLSAPLEERWRGLFHYERAAGEVSVARGMVSGISGLWAEGWSVGLEGREVFREEDTLRFFVRQDAGVRGGHMRIDHYVATGGSFVDAFYRRRPQSLEQRQTVIDLRGASRLHYALGYSRWLGKRTRLASGLEYAGQSKGIGVSLQLQVTF